MSQESLSSGELGDPALGPVEVPEPGAVTIVVPTFNDPADRRALETLAGLFPDRQVVGIHCVDLILGLGALHCLTQQEPAILSSR